MYRSAALGLFALLVCAGPSVAGGIGCEVSLNLTRYVIDTTGSTDVVIRLKRPDFDCCPDAYVEADPLLAGPVLRLERQTPNGDWTPVETPWRVDPAVAQVAGMARLAPPFRIDWGCALEVPRKAVVQPGVYRVRVAMTAPHVPDHVFEFTSKPFTVVEARSPKRG